jgi:hypothetical protein
MNFFRSVFSTDLDLNLNEEEYAISQDHDKQDKIAVAASAKVLLYLLYDSSTSSNPFLKSSLKA